MSKPSGFNRCGATCTALQDSIKDAVTTMKTANQEHTNEVEKLQAEVARLATVNSTTTQKSNADSEATTAEVARLKAEVERLHAELSQAKTKAETAEAAAAAAAAAAASSSSSSKPSVAEGKLAVSNGGGCGNADLYKEMMKTNWHGRLGRTHMADVDCLSDSAKRELDLYLHKTIKELFPLGRAYTNVQKDPVFAALSAFGLRLEDRGHFADVKIFTDAANTKLSTVSRLRNWAAWSYSHSSTWGWYWGASALETLLELARYRGLFTADGMLKDSI